MKFHLTRQWEPMYQLSVDPIRPISLTNEVNPTLSGSPLNVSDRSAQGFCRAMYQPRLLKPFFYNVTKMKVQPRNPSPEIIAVQRPVLIPLTNLHLPFFNDELRSRIKRTVFRMISDPSISDVQ